VLRAKKMHLWSLQIPQHEAARPLRLPDSDVSSGEIRGPKAGEMGTRLWLETSHDTGRQRQGLV
jgi:hypothetical protein